MLKVRSLVQILLCLLTALFASVADLAMGRAGLMPIQPTYLAISSLLLLLLIDGIFSLSTRFDQQLRVQVVKTHFFVILSYILISVLSLVFGALPGALWSEGGKWIFLIPLGCILWLSALFLCGVPVFARAAQKGIGLAWGLLTFSILYEVFAPGTFSNLTGRASGFAGNANFGALAVSMLCAANLRYDVKKSLFIDGLKVGLTFIAVLATQSRSGLLEFLMVGGFWIASTLFQLRHSPRQLLNVLSVLLLSCAITGTGLYLIVSEGELFSNQSSRFARILSGKDVDDGSGDERLAAAADTMRHISESPILGHGTGFSRTLQTFPHNIYLQQWVNNGILGLLSYLALLFSGGVYFLKHRYLPGVTFIVVCLIGGLFSHNILDQKSFFLTYAVLLSAVRARNSELQFP
jgi:O-antigen ligase